MPRPSAGGLARAIELEIKDLQVQNRERCLYWLKLQCSGSCWFLVDFYLCCQWYMIFDAALHF